jgi:serine/threonine-protein kinase
MELLDGLDLETLVASDGPQPPARAVKLLMQACRSLAEAHSSGLVHRDVKPANIFVCRIADEIDIVKVLDFGLVRSVTHDESDLVEPHSTTMPAPPMDLPGESSERPLASARAEDDQASGPRLTRADHVMGTPDFMAPEQAMGGEVDARADIYALGGVAYWLLAGRPVFLAKSVLAQLTAQMCELPVPIQDVCSEAIPPALAELVHSCLAKSPSERPQTAAELLERLVAIDREIGAEWDGQVHGWWQKWDGMRPSMLSTSATLHQEAATAQTLNIAVSVPDVSIVRAVDG